MTTIILIGHGSRESTALAEFYQTVDLLKKKRGYQEIEAAFFELATPSLPEAIAYAVKEGAERILALPLLLFPGRHMQEDIPHLLNEERIKFPGIEILLGRPLGAHPTLVELAAHRIGQARKPGAISPRRTSVLLVGHGSRKPHAINETTEFARRLQCLLPHFPVVHCFAEGGHPSIVEGFNRCVELGTESVIVFPCLLFTGVIMDRIYHQAQKMEEKVPWIQVSMSSHLGVHPWVAEAVWDNLKTCVPVSKVPRG